MSEPDRAPANRSTPPAITPLGYVDHSDYGEKGVKLVYAEQSDGVVVKVDRLELGLRPHLICPVCRKAVHRVRSKNDRLFFRHTSEAAGCGGPETNAHIWAKAQLLEAKEVLLPVVLSRFAGVNAPIQDARRFKFIDVLIEPLRGDLRPDLAVQVKDARGEIHELWIEIHVTHKCGPRKKAKIAARAQATIEIDLSAFRTSHDAPAIRKALLEGEDNRTWLFHRAQEEDFKARTKQVEEAQAAAQARIRAKAGRLVAAIRSARALPPEPGLAAIIAKVTEFGLGDVIGLPGPKAGFRVSQMAWQAALWHSLVILRQEADRADQPLKPSTALTALADYLPASLQESLSPEVIEAARAIDASFVAPQEAIARYFEALQQRGELWQGRDASWHVGHERSTAIYRRIERFRRVRDRMKQVTKRVKDLLAQLAEAPDFDMTAWLDQPCLDARTPRQMIEGREDLWEGFDGALQAIERMPAGWRPVDQLLGLPVEPLRVAALAREAEQKAAAARRKAEAEAKAAQDRIDALEASARRHLGDAAEAWLDKNLAEGVSFRQLAGQSSGGLERARNALWVRLQEIEAEAERQSRWTRNLTELGRHVFKLYDEVRGKVWMNGSHPKLGGLAPRDAVREDAGLKASLALLPRKPERSGH